MVEIPAERALHPPADHATGIVFPGVQKTTWTRDPEAKEYYWYRAGKRP